MQFYNDGFYLLQKFQIKIYVSRNSNLSKVITERNTLIIGSQDNVLSRRIMRDEKQEFLNRVNEAKVSVPSK